MPRQGRLHLPGGYYHVVEWNGVEICYWGTQVLGLTSTAIAIDLNIAQSSISKASKRGELYCQQFGIELEKI